MAMEDKGIKGAPVVSLESAPPPVYQSGNEEDVGACAPGFLGLAEVEMLEVAADPAQ